MASHRHFRHEHTVRWSRLVPRLGRFVFVFPAVRLELPHGTLDAFDFLSRESANKPRPVS